MRASRTAQPPSVGAARTHGSTRATGGSISPGATFAALLLTGVTGALVTYGVPLEVMAAKSESVQTAAGALIAVGLTVALLLLDFRLFAAYLVCVTLLQNALIGFWLPDTIGATAPVGVSEAKTVAIVTAGLLSAPLIIRLLLRRKASAFFLAVLAVLALTNFSTVSQASLGYARNFFVGALLILVFASRTTTWSPESRRQLLGQAVGIASVVLAVGMVAEASIGTHTWRDAVKADSIDALAGLSTVTEFFGVALGRIGGLIVEPTNAGYISASVVVVALAALRDAPRSSRVGWRLVAVVGGVGILASGAKNGVLMVVLGAVALWLMRKIPVMRAHAVLLASAFSVVLIYASLSKGELLLQRLSSDPVGVAGGDSTTFHLAGLFSGIQGGLAEPFGNGLGNGGNLSKQAGTTWEQWLGSGSESSFGVISYQLGIVGLVAFIGFFVSFASRWGAQSNALIVTWLAAAMFAEALLGPQSSLLLLAGAALLRHEADAPGGLSPTSARASLAVGAAGHHDPALDARRTHEATHSSRP